MSAKQIIDIHVHSSLKPFGKSIKENADIKSIDDNACIWHQDQYSVPDEHYEDILGLARYRQSDCTSMTEGNIQIACVSLYPLEKGFTQLQGGLLRLKKDALLNFVTMLGGDQIDFLQSDEYNYFEAYKKEYNYLLELHNKIPDGGNQKYKLLQNADDLVSDANLFIIPTVEGCHFLCEGNDTENPANWANLEENVAYLKNQAYPLFFVTFAHHFYNGLCTHAQSLFGFVGKALNQKRGMRDIGFEHNDDLLPISDLGKELIRLLLSKENGNRILIDIKHMSKEARNEYYTILNSIQYKDEKIPIICSHGAFAIDENSQINLDYEDVHQIYASNGIIGIEIDQRILGYNDKKPFQRIGLLFRGKRKRAMMHALYIWRQIKTIAEYAYEKDFSNPWQCIAMGTDYDGIINPLDSYRDSSSMGTLYENLINHLNDYWEDDPKIPRNYNGDAKEIIHQIMYQNAFNFIETHYLKTIKDERPIV